ncbi:MAG: hypothetical protein Q9221_004177 [Calogaya cf. arnoldii]
MGTPHRGSDKTGYADLISRIASAALRQPNRKLVEVLKQDSDVLEAQRSSFSAISKDLPIACIYETVPVKGIGLVCALSSTLHVPEYSACMDGFYVEREQIEANHMEMCKFNDPDDIGYRRTAGFILDFSSVIVLLNDLWFPEIRDREEDIKEAHAQTFRWLLEESNPNMEPNIFVKWLRQSRSEAYADRIFWISGKAGSGKSTLMKYIYRTTQLRIHLNHWAGNIPLLIPAVFIWDRGKSLMHKSREGMVRSLLHQILTSQKHLVPSVFPIKWNKEYAIRSADNAMSWMNHTRESPPWDWRELIEAFQTLTDPSWQRIQNAQMRICVFVDGMDEYRTLDDSTLSPNEVINRKKDGYREITEFFEALACSPDVKLCLSSRPLTEFKDAFNTKERALKLEDLTHGDISCYTRASLQQNKRFTSLATGSSTAAQQLMESIVDKAQGVFLWVVLVIRLLLDSLQDGDKLHELQSILEKIPQELGGEQGLYALMLKNIKLEHRRQCLELLELVRSSKSPPTPLSLAFADGACDYQLFDAIESIKPLSGPQAQYRAGQIEDRLRSRCAGLLELVPTIEHRNAKDLVTGHLDYETFPQIRVQFMHQTAKDFAEQPELRKFFLPEVDSVFNPYPPLLVSCILELKLTDPLHPCVFGPGRTQGGTARNWDLICDAMLYAFREEIRELILNPQTPICFV